MSIGTFVKQCIFLYFGFKLFGGFHPACLQEPALLCHVSALADISLDLACYDVSESCGDSHANMLFAFTRGEAQHTTPEAAHESTPLSQDKHRHSPIHALVVLTQDFLSPYANRLRNLLAHTTVGFYVFITNTALFKQASHDGASEGSPCFDSYSADAFETGGILFEIFGPLFYACKSAL